MTFADLLFTANLVQADNLSNSGVIEIGNMWIIECDVPIFSDAKKTNVDGVFQQ